MQNITNITVLWLYCNCFWVYREPRQSWNHLHWSQKHFTTITTIVIEISFWHYDWAAVLGLLGLISSPLIACLRLCLTFWACSLSRSIGSWIWIVFLLRSSMIIKRSLFWGSQHCHTRLPLDVHLNLLPYMFLKPHLTRVKFLILTILGVDVDELSHCTLPFYDRLKFVSMSLNLLLDSWRHSHIVQFWFFFLYKCRLYFYCSSSRATMLQSDYSCPPSAPIYGMPAPLSLHTDKKSLPNCHKTVMRAIFCTMHNLLVPWPLLTIRLVCCPQQPVQNNMETLKFGCCKWFSQVAFWKQILHY